MAKSITVTDKEYEALLTLGFIKNSSSAKEDEEQEEKFPKYDDEFYVIDSDGSVQYFRWRDSFTDNEILNFGNVFKTKQEAEFEAEKIRVINQLKQYAEPKERKMKYGVPHFMIIYDKKESRLVIDRFSTMFPVSISFETQEMAEKAIEEVGADKIKKYLFNGGIK